MLIAALVLLVTFGFASVGYTQGSVGPKLPTTDTLTNTPTAVTAGRGIWATGITPTNLVVLPTGTCTNCGGGILSGDGTSGITSGSSASVTKGGRI